MKKFLINNNADIQDLVGFLKDISVKDMYQEKVEFFKVIINKEDIEILISKTNYEAVMKEIINAIFKKN